jgi:hypothetical protein
MVWGETYYSLFGTTGFGCGRQHPIWIVLPEFQATYASMVAPSVYQQTLREIDSPDEKIAERAAEKIYKAALKKK